MYKRNSCIIEKSWRPQARLSGECTCRLHCAEAPPGDAARDGLARRVPAAPSSLSPSTPLGGFKRKLPQAGHVTQRLGPPCTGLRFASLLLLCWVLMRAGTRCHTRGCQRWAAPASVGTRGAAPRRSQKIFLLTLSSPAPSFCHSFWRRRRVDTGLGGITCRFFLCFEIVA